MEAKSEVGAPDDPRILFRLEPPRAKLHAARRQPGESTLELHTTGAVAGDENHQVGKPTTRGRRLPPANPIFEPPDGFDHNIEVLVFGPARRTDDESVHAKADTEAPEQSLAKLLALHPIERHEDCRRPVVQHLHLLHAESILDE